MATANKQELEQRVEPSGHVAGVDFTYEQLAKAEELRARAGFDRVSFHSGRIEDLPR